MVNSFFCFIISFFPFSLLFDYIYGTFAMETFPLCLLFRIRRHHLRHRCDKKKTTTRIWYKTIFVKKGDQLTPGIYTKSVFVCLFAPVSDDDFAFSFHPRRRIKSVFYCYSLFIYYFLLSATKLSGFQFLSRIVRQHLPRLLLNVGLSPTHTHCPSSIKEIRVDLKTSGFSIWYRCVAWNINDDRQSHYIL